MREKVDREAYRLKVMFDEFWQIKDMQKAQGYLAF